MASPDFSPDQRPTPEEFGEQLRAYVEPQTPEEMEAFMESVHRVKEKAIELRKQLPPPTGEIDDIRIGGHEFVIGGEALEALKEISALSKRTREESIARSIATLQAVREAHSQGDRVFTEHRDGSRTHFRRKL